MRPSKLTMLILVLIFSLFISVGCSKKQPETEVITKPSSEQSTSVPTVTTVPTTTETAEAVTKPVDESTDFTKITYRTIHTMGTMYDVLMRTAGELYKEKLITEEQKAQLIDLGYIYYGSYQGLVTAFETYEKSKNDEDKISITLMVIETVKKYNKVLEYYNDVTKGIKGVQQWTKISS